MQICYCKKTNLQVLLHHKLERKNTAEQSKLTVLIEMMPSLKPAKESIEKELKIEQCRALSLAERQKA